jgi:hypothetical protein
MLTESEIKSHINRLDTSHNVKVYSDVEQIELVRAYIFDRKGVDIGGINRPTGRIVYINNGNNINGMTHDVVLLQQMHDTAMEWFAKKYHHVE